MVSLIFAHNFMFSQQPISFMSSPIFLVITPPKIEHPLRIKRRKFKEKKQKNQLLLEFSECCGGLTMCKRWEVEGDSELELKVLEFMKNSKNPQMFPSKRDLVEAGRVDLVEEIVKRGGWMSLGWNNDDNEVKIDDGLVESFDFGGEKCGKFDGDGDEVNNGNGLGKSFDFDGEKYGKIDNGGGEVKIDDGLVESFDFGGERYGKFDNDNGEVKIDDGLGKSSDFDGEKCGKIHNGGGEVKIGNELGESFDFGVEKYGEFDGNEDEKREVSKELDESNGSIEVEREEVSGIEGILQRLEKQRNISFGTNSERNVNTTHGFGEQSSGSSTDVDSCHPEGSVPASLGLNGPMYSGNGSVRSYSNTSSSSLKADTWRAWSDQRAGYSDKEFEAEIDFGGKPDIKTPDDSLGEILAVTDIKEGLELTKDLDSLVRDISQTDIKSRLQHLKLELSSALRSLNSNATDLSEKVEEHSSEDLTRLSDASEFQETEFMHTQHKLRSMRANLAVLEGKMALAMIDAQKILEEKQKRIDDARVALQLLRTTCIVWPNSGSEVLLAGSFDGWATQWKMERSSTGIFSLWLKLYPGQYEIKFIVDGIWMVDPLRPIVNHSGFENNLLLVS
ncbi:hypothetical protein vseg_015058 [Gypsophila vaccaria]